MSAKEDRVRRVVRAILADKEAPTIDEIKEAVSQAATVAYADHTLHGELNEPSVVREFESIYSVYFAAPSRVLEDKTGHVPWLPDAKGGIQWDFWGRYEFFLREVQRLPPQVVARLGTSTDEVLAQFENPVRQGIWDRRGLVVGNVQSGKTSNYSGLICKALDSKYKLIVVLAGIHNSLRSQTQMRIDQGIIGFDTSQNPAFSDDNRWIGVGVLPGWPRLRVNALTSSRNDGDFSRGTAQRITTALGGDPYVLVIKKNKSILANLIKWALHVNGSAVPGGRKVIRDVPILVIDDEADMASINTARVPPGEDPNDYDPTAINKMIRELLGSFEKCAYVGYTATPFANIFVPDEREDDVFPRSFIYSLTEPSNYVGAARVFGLAGDPDAGIEPQEGLPIVRTLTDYLPFFPDKYKKDHDPKGLPPSLLKAVRVFLLSSAARRARGQAKQHNSMLIHIARFVDVQSRLGDLVQEALDQLVRSLRYAGKGDDSIHPERRRREGSAYYTTMPRLLVLGFSISLDGYGAGPHQSMKEPLGVGGEELHDWLVHTRTFKGMQGSKEGDTGIDEEFAARAMAGLGAWIMGRNMFGPIRGPWPDDSWRGWWGKNPPYHTPVFVLTHHKRSPVEMEGGTVFHFVTEGIQAALERARETLKAFASLTPGESPGLLEDGATCGHTVPMGSLLTRFPVAA